MVKMPEKMIFRSYIHHTLVKSMVAIIDAVLLIKDAQRWLVGEQHIRIVWDATKQFGKDSVKVILHEHRHPIELEAINGSAFIAEIMHIIWQTFNVGTIKAVVVIPGNENLVGIRKAAKPFDEVLDFLFGAIFSNIASVNDNVCFRQID